MLSPVQKGILAMRFAADELRDRALLAYHKDGDFQMRSLEYNISKMEVAIAQYRTARATLPPVKDAGEWT